MNTNNSAARYSPVDSGYFSQFNGPRMPLISGVLLVHLPFQVSNSSMGSHFHHCWNEEASWISKFKIIRVCGNCRMILANFFRLLYLLFWKERRSQNSGSTTM